MMDKHDDTFTVDMLVSNIIKPISSGRVECSSISYSVERMSTDFPRYFCWMAGFAESYVWPIPLAKEFDSAQEALEDETVLSRVILDVVDLICALDDVLSFC